MAYVIGRYPAVSHTFILREVRALEARGCQVRTFSIWKTYPSQLLAKADREEAARTTALLPLRLRMVVGALAVLLRRPQALRAALGEARTLSDGMPGWRRHLLTLGWILESAMIVHACRAAGIRHVHAHLGGTAPAVALLTAVVGCAHDGPGTWTWSFTVHGPDEFYAVFREGLQEKVRRATFVVAISDFARSQLMTLADEGGWDKIHVVRCGIDPSVYEPVAPAGPEDGPVRVLCVGRLTRIKGQGVLLQATRELVDRGVAVEVTIVGDGPKRDDLEDLTADLGLQDVVRFAGAVGQDAIRREYAAADLFCLSSFAEGVPIVLMEAMGMGKPVVASRIMGVPELVEDGVNGRLVAPGRPDLLADALAELAADPALRRRMGAAGRATVVREFSVAAQAENLHHLFDRFASQA